jgi:hypothetical protein
MRFKWISLGITSASILLCIVVIWWLLQPWWLTWLHGDELRPAIQKYFEITSTIEGNRDPNIIAQVTTGKHRDYLVRVRCVECPGVQVATRIEIPILKVFDYSSNTSKVGVRIEYGWRLVDTQTGVVIGSCHAQAFSTVMILVQENGVWKVADGGEAWGWERNPVDDSSELRAKYCPQD